MQFQARTRKNSLTVISFLTLLVGSNPIMAQVVGTMDYESGVYSSVPVGGGIFMLVLGALLGIAAFWKISRSGISGNKAIAVFLTLGAATFALSGGQILQQASAESAKYLSSPTGGTVDVYAGYQEYENASGVPLVIGALDFEDCYVPTAYKDKDGGQGTQVGSNTQTNSFPECVPGLALPQNGDICYTNVNPCDSS